MIGPSIAYIPVGEQLFSLIDASDLWLVENRSWFVSTKPGGKPYAISKRERMHRLIANPPEGRVVDHVNGNTLDNRRCNLRICTVSQNNCNRVSRSNQGLKGVYLCSTNPNQWWSSIRVHGKAVHLGSFSSPEAAHEAYKKAAAQYHKDFAYPQLEAPNGIL
jgi:hypothetical protein